MAHSSDESHSQEEDSEISESEIKDYSETIYSKLKSKHYRVKKRGKYRCPFCPGKKKQSYPFKDLLQHATGIAASHKHKPIIRSQHQAVAKYLKNDLVNPNLQLQVAQVVPPPPQKTEEEKYVYPWRGILVNVPIEYQNGKYEGKKEDQVREILYSFKPLEFYPLKDEKGHLGKCMVEFGTEWNGFNNAMSFEKYFNSKGRGRKGYKLMKEKERRDREICGWVAMEEDYNGSGPVSDHLKQSGVLKSIDDVMNERKSEVGTKLVDIMVQIEEKNDKLRDMECKYNIAELSMQKIAEDKEIMTHSFNENMKNMEDQYGEYIRQCIVEKQSLSAQMELMIKELEARDKLIDIMDSHKRNHEQETEQKKIELVRQAEIEQQKMLTLVEDQQREKAEALNKILQLEKELDAKQQLELEMEKLKGQIGVMKHMGGAGGNDDSAFMETLESLKEQLKEKEKEEEEMEKKRNMLVMKERETNDQLQETRKYMIQEMSSMMGGPRALITIKRMGELDVKAFQKVFMQKYRSRSDADIEAVQACTKLQDEIQKPEWHPFKVIIVEGEEKEVIREEDEKLMEVRQMYGEEIYNVVVTGLKELNEYNPSGRYVVSEFWHTKLNRKATTREVVQYIFRQWKPSKGKK